MKNSIRILTAIALVSVVAGCFKDKHIFRYEANVPVYLSYELMRSSVVRTSPQAIKDPGKIYLYNNYILMNERNKGIHIIDNSNPAAPVNTGFIDITGNIDVSCKDNFLYADNYIDLVAIDITDLNNIKVVKRLKHIFPYSVPEYDTKYKIAKVDTSKGVVMGWVVKEISEECVGKNCDEDLYYGEKTMTVNESGGVMYLASADAGGNSSGKNSIRVSKGGSMARFSVYQDYLYAIDNENLKIINISPAGNPQFASEFNIGQNVETLFNYSTWLFIGSQSGVLIYDLSNPSVPSYLSRFSHIRSCDPVVVSGNYAYSTLRAGSGCGGWSNQLDVINISNITLPMLMKSYSLNEPYGLGFDGSILFVCDGEKGLKIYDATNPPSLTMKSEFSGVNAYDVIPYNGLLLLTGKDGLYQYDYSDINNLKQISFIPKQ